MASISSRYTTIHVSGLLVPSLVGFRMLFARHILKTYPSPIWSFDVITEQLWMLSHWDWLRIASHLCYWHPCCSITLWSLLWPSRIDRRSSQHKHSRLTGDGPTVWTTESPFDCTPLAKNNSLALWRAYTIERYYPSMRHLSDTMQSLEIVFLRIKTLVVDKTTAQITALLSQRPQ